MRMNTEQSLNFMIFHETQATDWSMLWFLTLCFSLMQVFPIESLLIDQSIDLKAKYVQNMKVCAMQC